jgi:predicted small secreted protein
MTRRGVMRNSLSIVLVALLLAACDTFEGMQDVFDTQKLVQTEIEKKYGWETQVAFRIENDVLIQVTVTFEANAVRDESVGRLEEIVLEAVAGSFENAPEVVYIQIASRPRAEPI